MFIQIINTIIENIRHNSNKICLVASDYTLSYQDFGKRCQAIYDVIVNNSSKVIAIYGHKEKDTIASMFACVLANKSYVFIDTTLREERLLYVTNELEISVILNTSGSQLSSLFDSVEIIDTTLLKDNAFSKNSFLILNLEDIFYYIYTSGTTGKPKGIQITYNNFNAFMLAYDDVAEIDGENVAHINHSLFSFDMSMIDIWFFMGKGMSLILLHKKYNALLHKNIEFLRDVQEKYNIYSCFLTPVFISALCQSEYFNTKYFPNLKQFYIGGDAWTKSTYNAVKKNFLDGKIWNIYGPSETTCITHCCLLSDSNISTILPIGKAMGDNVIKIKNESFEDCHTNTIEEVVIYGSQVSIGYTKLELNSAFLDTTPRGYKTGDLGYLD